MINVGLVGATGIVGDVFIELLNERNFPVGELRPFASEQSAGNKINFQGREFEIQTLKENCFDGLDLVFFSSGDPISKEWAPKAVASGAFAVDNSAAFRLDENTPLIVPEVNGHLLPDRHSPALIANPNCSTIQLVVALHPLAKKFGLERVVVSSYQAASGAGKAAIQELKDQLAQELAGEKVTHKEFSAPLAMNCIPQIGSFDETGFSSEERKIIFESRKILGLPELSVSAFTVRIPTLVGHAESVWATFQKPTSHDEINECLQEAPGIVVHESPYPMVSECRSQNPVYVGRIHQDLCDTRTWLFWVVADNLRKGAALNGLQIAEHIFDITP